MITALQEILDSRFLHNSNELIERQQDFSMNVDICSSNKENYIVYKFDANTNLFPYFTSKKHLKKICDYVVFFEKGNDLYVAICELKKSNNGNNNSICNHQLEATKLFVNFIINSLKRLNNTLITDENVKYYKLRFCDNTIKRLAKKRTAKDIRDNMYANRNTVYEYKKDSIRFLDFV